MPNNAPRWRLTYRRAGAEKAQTHEVEADSMVTAIKRAQQELHDAHPGDAIRISLCEPMESQPEAFSAAHDLVSAVLPSWRIFYRLPTPPSEPQSIVVQAATLDLAVAQARLELAGKHPDAEIIVTEEPS